MNTLIRKNTAYKYNPEGFIDFTQKGARLSDVFISIIPKGGFTFSSGFVHSVGLDRFQFCSLAFNPQTYQVRFKFNNMRDREGNFGIVRASGSCTLPCVSFFRWHGLDCEALRGRYEGTVIDENSGVIIVDLNEKLGGKDARVGGHLREQN